MSLPRVFIVGVVDNLGYLFCTECRDITNYDDGFVWSDSGPHADEDCEGCGRNIRMVPFRNHHAISDPRNR